MSPGCGFTMPKKKLVCPCLEISVAAEDDVWREKDGDAVLEMGAQRKRQRLWSAPQK